MGFIEIRLHEQIEEKYGIKIKNHVINKWWRYLDDCFLIWDTRIESIENLLLIVQGLHRSITFTAEESRKEISFLGIITLPQTANNTFTANPAMPHTLKETSLLTLHGTIVL